MIDIKLVRENPEIVRENLKKRGMNEKDVDNLISLDKNWRDVKSEVDKLRARRNKVSEEINQAKKQNKNTDSLIKEAKDIPKKIENLEKELSESAEKRDS